jgi:hypothetical protein
MVSFFSDAYSQAYRFKIVNLITANQNDETSNDTEPNIAVNPANPLIMAASAFTLSLNRTRPDGTLICDTFPCPNLENQIIGPGNSYRHANMSNCLAPIYFSIDGGETWVLKDMLPSNNGITHDITLAFSEAGYLYAAILKGCEFGRIDLSDPNNNLKGFTILRSPSPLNSISSVETLAQLVPLDNRFGIKYDMPWVIAKTESNRSGDSPIVPSIDHVFVGINNFSKARSQNRGDPNAKGQSSTVLVCNNGASSNDAFNDFTDILIETVPQHDKNPAGVRLAAHESGKVYAIFYRVITRTPLPNQRAVEQCDVVLVRDDDFGRSHFRNLFTGNTIEPNIIGGVVGNVVTVPLHYLSGPLGFLDGNRLTGSDLAVAIDPNNSNHVFAAWGSLDRDASSGQEVYSLHFRHNTNGGVGNWLHISESLNSIKRAFNPAIAVTNDGRVGFLYQQLTDENWWETHFVMAQIRRDETGRNPTERRFDPIHDWVLSRFQKNEFTAVRDNRRQLSDYLDLQAVGNSFCGVFAAINTPDPIGASAKSNSRFPTERPIYLRDQTRLLPGKSGERAVVNPSIDPFFFKVDYLRPERVCERCLQESSIIRLRPDASLTNEFSLPMKIIYEKSFNARKLETKPGTPYFHLLLEGYNPNELDLNLLDVNSNIIEHEVNNTKTGYAISFKTSDKYFNIKDGFYGLYLIFTIKDAKYLKDEKVLNYKLEISDKPFKEFIITYK